MNITEITQRKKLDFFLLSSKCAFILLLLSVIIIMFFFIEEEREFFVHFPFHLWSVVSRQSRSCSDACLKLVIASIYATCYCKQWSSLQETPLLIALSMMMMMMTTTNIFAHYIYGIFSVFFFRSRMHTYGIECEYVSTTDCWCFSYCGCVRMWFDLNWHLNKKSHTFNSYIIRCCMEDFFVFPSYEKYFI